MNTAPTEPTGRFANSLSKIFHPFQQYRIQSRRMTRNKLVIDLFPAVLRWRVLCVRNSASASRARIGSQLERWRSFHCLLPCQLLLCISSHSTTTKLNFLFAQKENH